jgi:curved DNA-binding protein CbpA
MTIHATSDLYKVLQVDPAARPSVIQAAYRALARELHPDQSALEGTERAMAVLNHAYGILRDPMQRQEYDRSRSVPPPPAPASIVSPAPQRAAPPPPAARPGERTVDFGRYRGWSLEALAKRDPDYLEWLKRHSSGVGYRRQIDELLAKARDSRTPLRVGAR